MRLVRAYWFPLLVMAVAVVGRYADQASPTDMDYAAVLQGPGANHLLGTDELGRDILARMLSGAQLSLLISIAAVGIGGTLGITLGLVSGYFAGWTDEVIMRLMDSFMSLPPLVLALTITALLGSGLLNATIAISIVSIPTFTRLIRGQALVVRSSDYIAAALCVGVSAPRLLFRHMLPNVINPFLVMAAIAVGQAMIIEASLSFIGLGAQPPVSTLGSMVQTGFQFLEIAPSYVFTPAMMIFFLVLSCNVLANVMRQSKY
jgi:peptide/nickel transport system permease protein